MRNVSRRISFRAARAFSGDKVPADEQETRVPRGVRGGVHRVDQPFPVLDAAVEPRRLPAAEDHRQQVPGVDVRAPHRGAVEPHFEVGAPRVLLLDDDPGLPLRRLDRPRGFRRGTGGKLSERPLDQRAGRFRVDVPRDHQHHVPGNVVRAEVGQEILAGRLPDGVDIPDDGAPVRVDLVRLPEEGVGDDPPRVVLVHPHLLEDHLEFPRQLRGVEDRVPERVGEDVERVLEESPREGDVVDRLVEARVGVDLAPHRLDLPGDLPGPPALRPLERHVLEDVGHPRAGFGFRGAARLDPRLHRHDRRRRVRPDHDRQPVAKHVCFDQRFLPGGGSRSPRDHCEQGRAQQPVRPIPHLHPSLPGDFLGYEPLNG